MGKYTVGLIGCKVGTADSVGSISGASNCTKQFKVYNDTCEISHGAPSVTEHKEENNAIPVVQLKEKMPPKIKFQVMETDAATLTMLLGGANVTDYDGGSTGFGMDGTEDVSDKYFVFNTLQGQDIIIPNGSISANMSGKLSKTGIALIDVEVTPLAVTGGSNKPFYMIPKSGTVRTVTMSATGCTTNLNAVTTVENGSDLLVQFTPDANKTLSSFTVGGTEKKTQVGDDNAYLIKNISANIAIVITCS